jgi:hypothetical protein
MDSRIIAINIGFKGVIFLSRESKVIQDIIDTKVNDPKIAWTANRSNGVKVRNIDSLHDKLSLKYGDEVVEGTITWRVSADRKHFVFSKFEM